MPNAAAAPATTFVSSIFICPKPSPSLTTSPRIPRSLTSRLVPAPRQKHGTPARNAEAFACISSVSSSTLTNKSAGPPIRKEVSSASGIDARTRAPNFARNSPSSSFMNLDLGTQRVQDFAARLVDIARTQSRDHIARARACRDSSRGIFLGAEVMHFQMSARAQRLVQAPRRDVGNRLLAGRIYGEQIKHVGIVERRQKIVEQIPQPRVPMRLEDRDHAALERRPHGGQRSPHFGRMMRVVVEHDASRRFAFDLESPADSTELRQRRRRALEADSNFHRDRDRRERVQRNMN